MVPACKKSVTVGEYDLVFADIVDIGDIGESAFVKTREKQIRELRFELGKGAFGEIVTVFCMYEQLMGEYLDIEYIVGGDLFLLVAVRCDDIARIAVILADSVVKLLHIDGVRLILQDIPEGSYRIALTGEFFIAGQEYDNDLIVYFSDEFSGFQTVETGHFDIENDDSVFVPCELGKEISACSEFVKGKLVLIGLKGREILLDFS